MWQIFQGSKVQLQCTVYFKVALLSSKELQLCMVNYNKSSYVIITFMYGFFILSYFLLDINIKEHKETCSNKCLNVFFFFSKFFMETTSNKRFRRPIAFQENHQKCLRLQGTRVFYVKPLVLLSLQFFLNRRKKQTFQTVGKMYFLGGCEKPPERPNRALLCLPCKMA